jgi:carbonic anhydrase
MRRYIALACGTLMIAGPLTAMAEMRPVLKHRAGVPPFTVVDAMMRGNGESVERATQPPPENAPHLTWLADCDHRAHPGLIMADPGGKVYAVCTLGNQLAPATAAVDFGVRVLYSPVLLITGQTGSEAIRLFQTRPDAVGEEVRRALASLELPPPKAKAPERKKGGNKGKAAASPKSAATKEPAPTGAPVLPVNLVERNVDYQVAQAVARYRERIANGRLVVIGGVLDLANQYGEGANRLFLININGETDPAKLKKSPHLVRLDPRQLTFVGRRPTKAMP